MSKDGAIETVDTIVAIETVDPTWTDEPIERLSTKGKRKLDLLGPVLVSSPRPKYQHVETGNALFDAVPLFDPMLDKVCEQSNKALRTPVRKLLLAAGFQPSAGHVQESDGLEEFMAKRRGRKFQDKAQRIHAS